MSEYPKMLFRDAEDEPMLVWEGRNLDHCTVADAGEEAEALAEGWRVHGDPLDHDGDGRKGGAQDLDRLRAELAAAQAENEALKARRSPGRPKQAEPERAEEREAEVVR